MNVCTVIGGCGFLGRHMVDTLLSNGYQVKVFDLRITYANNRVQFYTGNMCCKEVSY